jgi:uncharacterized protein (DUF488 family)
VKLLRRQREAGEVSGQMVVYTLGTSDRRPDDCLALLTGLGIEAVVDVRRFPTSRFPHFRKEELAPLLQRGGFAYLHLGEKLGGYRSMGYQAFMSTAEFQQGLGQLEELARVKRVVVLCAERLPWRCHRRFIGRELARHGFTLEHVIDEKRRWVPRSQSDGDD